MQNITSTFRSGFVAIVGQPNVGKSTLLNALLGEKIAIVSPRPQTTRARQLGILTSPEFQIIFVDTPGIHTAHNALGKFMVEVASDAIPDADVVVFVVDAQRPPNQIDEEIAQSITESGQQNLILALNKLDAADVDNSTLLDDYRQLVPFADHIDLSALNRRNLPVLLERIVDKLPTGPMYYPPDQLTETFVRDSAAELIREQILYLFDDEIPHAVGVKIDEFKERTEHLTYISAMIYVERDSQKGIIIGKKGAMLKKLGELSRAQLESMLDTKVYLDLWVKVLKNWRKNDVYLRELGYYHQK